MNLLKPRYAVLISALVTLAWTGAKGQSAHDAAVHHRPNILVIMADDMGFSDIGCYGGEIHTPHIDRLAAEGVRFTRFYNNAWCSPTRASLLTGVYPQQAGMAVLAGEKPGPPGPTQGYLGATCVTLAEVLKQSGYYTALSGKWHVGEYRPHWPTDRGFDHYFGLISGAANYFDITKTKSPTVTRHMAFNDQPYTPPKKGFYMTDAITEDAVRVLNDRGASDTPFFLYVAYTAPHFPLQAPPKDIAPYKNTYQVGWDSIRRARYHRQLRLGIVNSSTKLSPPDPGIHPWNSLTPQRQKEMAAKMAVYAGQVSHMDDGVGRILEALARSGKAENTVVIFLSDNGGCAEGGIWGFDKRNNGLPPGGVDSYMSYGESWANASNTPFRYYKKWLAEGGIATPLIVRWPAKIDQKREGSILNQTGHVTDFMPTFCALAGASYPRTYKGNTILPMVGESLAGVIESGVSQPHQPIYWSLRGHKSVIFDHYQLVSAGKADPWHLYDLGKDRSERDDIAAGNKRLVRQYGMKWMKWARAAGVFEEPVKKRAR